MEHGAGRSAVRVNTHLVAGKVSLFASWVAPAAVCGVLIVGVRLVSPAVGGAFGLAGGAYLVTNLIIVLALALVQRFGTRSARPHVILVTAASTAAWVVGIVTFGLVGILLEGIPDDSWSGPQGGFVLSPVFWLLSFPIFLVFLVSALVHSDRPRRWGGRSR